jgi:hypothetical protein
LGFLIQLLTLEKERSCDGILVWKASKGFPSERQPDGQWYSFDDGKDSYGQSVEFPSFGQLDERLEKVDGMTREDKLSNFHEAFKPVKFPVFIPDSFISRHDGK